VGGDPSQGAPSGGTSETIRHRSNDVTKRRAYLIQDPYDLDALAFIDTIYRYFGLRPVCFYTNVKGRFYGEQQFPQLRTDIVEASYDVDLADLPRFAAEVTQRYDIVAIVPYREDTVEVAAELLALLDLDWNDADTLARFRDKHALKTYVHERSGIRVPVCRRVNSVDDVWSDPPPAKFVLKPNSGFGNRDVGVFTSLDRDGVAAHVTPHPDVTWILEEFIEGREFAINGMVRGEGDVVILGIYESIRKPANGHASVYHLDRALASTDPEFAELCDYARDLLVATGLRRCPFHLEVRYDGQGPCVIDLGARFPSEGGATYLTMLHPSRPAAIDVAAHDYFGPNDFATQPIDWAEHDRNLVMYSYGVTSDDTVVHSLHGIEEIAAMPEFVRWTFTPRIGDRIVPTRELRDAPYIGEFRQPSTHEGIEALDAKVRRTVQWNQSARTVDRVSARIAGLTRRGRAKARWIRHQVTRRVQR
jgi:hypothetical protein